MQFIIKLSKKEYRHYNIGTIIFTIVFKTSSLKKIMVFIIHTAHKLWHFHLAAFMFIMQNRPTRDQFCSREPVQFSANP